MLRGKPARERRIRQQGTGSVFWNAAKGRYQGTVELGQTAAGGRIRKTYTARAKGQTREAREECEAWLARAQAEALAGTIQRPSRETVQGFLEEWAAMKSALTWGERSAQEQPAKLQRHVYPVIGSVRLNQLEAGHITRVLATMARTVSKHTGRRLSRQTQLAVYRILHSALRGRIRWDEVETPVVKQRPPSLPEPEAVAAILADAAATRHGVFFVLMGLTGARPQELLGLRRADLDFERSSFSINEVMVTRGAPHFKEAKTEQSHRTIEVDPEAMALLRAYGDERAALQLRAGRVFCNDEGTPLTLWRLYTVWRGILRRLGLPYFKPYLLRHFAASYWLDEGLSLASVSAALGHSTQRTTAGIYSHKLRRSESRIAQAGGKLLRLGRKEDAADA